MSLQWREREVRIPALYLGAVCIAVMLPLVTGSPFAGIWAVLLTAPWSFLLVAITDAASPELMDRGWFVMTALAFAGLVNASLLHLLLRSRARFQPPIQS